MIVKAMAPTILKWKTVILNWTPNFDAGMTICQQKEVSTKSNHWDIAGGDSFGEDTVWFTDIP